MSAKVKIIFTVILLSCFVITNPFPAYSKTKAKVEGKKPVLSGKERVEMFKGHTVMKAASPYKDHAWQYVGPTNISGRCTDVEAVSPRGSQYTIWIGAATGGVWKSVNEGTTFEPVFDRMPTASIGDIAIDPKNPDVVWVGTGEANIFRSSNAGCGVFKTTDGGKTWKNMGLENTHTIPRIRIHPENSDIVYVAANGHEWTPNEERGLYKTTDGGKTWKKTLYVDRNTGVNDLVIDPRNPDTVYCTTWQRIRLKWNDPRTYENHKNNGIWKSTDGGANWEIINQGLPAPGFIGRTGIDICASNPSVLYALVDNYEIAKEAKPGDTDSYGRQKKGIIKGATVYRTADSGKTWTQTSGLTATTKAYMESHSATYGWVFGQIRVDPNNENRVYTMGLMLHVSDDGGKTFKILGGMHPDHHGLWIDPNNSDYLLNVQDGGISISYDRGANWKIPLKELPLAQFYNVAFDMEEPFRIYGSIQDHHSFYGEVDLSRGRNGIQPVEFTETVGAEGSTHAIDTRDNTAYASQFYGNLAREKVGSGKRKFLLPETVPGEPPLRGQWVAPTIISPHNSDIIYHGMQFVMMSRDRGDTWVKISPDLSYNDPNKRGDISYQTLTALSESPRRFGLIYAGTDDGRVWRTFNGGKKWQEIGGGTGSAKNVPVRWVSRLVASKYNLGTVYLTQTGRRDDDFQVYIWKSTDFGKTWTDISGNIPVGPVNVICEDPSDARKLYVGTDTGVYFSKNGGEKWDVLGNLPFAYVHDLAIHPRDNMIIIATHGRGMWVYDIEQMTRKPKVGRNRPLSPKDIETLAGTWTVKADMFSLTLLFEKKGDTVAGKMIMPMGEAVLKDIDFNGTDLSFASSFEMAGRVIALSAEAEIAGQTLKGNFSSPMGKMAFTGEKEKKK